MGSTQFLVIITCVDIRIMKQTFIEVIIESRGESYNVIVFKITCITCTFNLLKIKIPLTLTQYFSKESDVRSVILSVVFGCYFWNTFNMSAKTSFFSW